MADLNKTDIKLIKSQRLDDTDQGGGQMIGGPSAEVISGQVNELFPDISRLDRTYGRVSLRKAYIGVQTTGQQTYYGSHSVITKNADDPHVSVCFFSSQDWFDTRENARQRIESYLVKGPIYTAALWGPHFLGTRQLVMFTEVQWPSPEIGDVLVLVKNEGLASQENQYVRVTSVTEEIRTFVSVNTNYQKKILTVEIGNQLLYDFVGQEVSGAYNYTSNTTKIYTTVAADASKYYGVATLSEAAFEDELHIRVDSIKVPLVPSAQSQTAITDAGIGQAVTPLLQIDEALTSVVRSIAFSIAVNSKLYIGEGVVPGSFSWTGGLTLTDDSAGNIYSGSTIVGSIEYNTGIITFSNVTGTTSGTGVATYKPACAPTLVAETGGIQVETNNRGFVYTFICDPLPKPGTLKVDFYSGGKWYSMKDRGDGAIRGSDTSIGAGAVNFLTGSVSLTLGAMPDVGSMVLFFWATNASFYNMNGETLSLAYSGTTSDPAIARGSFSCSWTSNTYAAVDNGNGDLTVGTWSVDHWVATATVIGKIKYATGEFEFGIHASQGVPSATEAFHIRYSYGNKFQETFNPIRNIGPAPPVGTVTFYLSNTPVLPNTFKIVWHTDQIEYYNNKDTSLIGIQAVDPTHTFVDNGAGVFENEDPSEFDVYFQSTINYTTGKVELMPDRVGVFPLPLYRWTNQRVQNVTEGSTSAQVESTQLYAFDRIQYMEAASLWPTDGIFTVEYSTVDGANSFDGTMQLEKAFYIKAGSFLELVPGSISFTAGSNYVVDVAGKLFANIVGTTGIGTEVGTINYALRKIAITNDLINSRSIFIKSAAGTAAIDPVQMIMFRTPGAPLTPGSLSIQATASTGLHITATSDFSGNITAANAVGKIDYDTGIGRISFGQWVADIYTAMPIDQRPPWFDTDNVVAGNVWKPISVSFNTVSINCVVYSYLPLDAELLGLDPVRLPLDGKVPIFRDGNIILIHHTLQQNLPNPVVAGNTYNLSRTNVNLIELYDSTGLYYPEIDGATVNYTYNLAAGTVTIGAGASFSGFTQPFYALHRIEDMVLASDVQITGHIAITNPLNHDYPANETKVSSVLPSKDLQARAYNEFVQTTWTGVWSDDLIGAAPLSRYDFVNYPINVKNNGCVKERWLIKFKTSTTFDIIGEHLGVLAENVATTGWPSGIISVTNRLTSEKYWEMNENGLGVGWSAGNCIRFNTDAANYPLWFVRTTLQAPPTEPTDDYQFQIRGDSA
jgi:hypothetical protein